jgi:hypothetical protein
LAQNVRAAFGNPPQRSLNVMAGLPLLGALLGTDLATTTGLGHLKILVQLV